MTYTLYLISQYIKPIDHIYISIYYTSKICQKYSRYKFRNDKLFHIKMSKLNKKIKSSQWIKLSISGCILWN